VADEPENEGTAGDSAPTQDSARGVNGVPSDRRYPQRNFAERLFPGPSPQMSEEFAKRIEGLIQDGGNDAAVQAWRERRNRKASSPEESRQRRAQRGASTPPAVESPTPPAAPSAPAPAPASDDFAELSEKLEQQNELLRAILASSVDTQTDARSTAQNSRTFAWAGTAIALLTLIATVISIVAAVQGH
jgi:hypothetical protein